MDWSSITDISVWKICLGTFGCFTFAGVAVAIFVTIIIARQIRKFMGYDGDKFYRKLFDLQVDAARETNRTGLLKVVTDAQNPTFKSVPYSGWTDYGRMVQFIVERHKGFIDWLIPPLPTINLVLSKKVRNRHMDEIVVEGNSWYAANENIRVLLPWNGHDDEMKETLSAFIEHMRMWGMGTQTIIAMVEGIKGQAQAHQQNPIGEKSAQKRLYDLAGSQLKGNSGGDSRED